MRVMFMIKGDPEPGAAPSEELLAAMGRYNDELKEAGVLLDLSALHPSANARRVKFSGGNRTVIEGAVPRVEGIDCGVLDPSSEVDGRGRRMGQACPVRGAFPNLPRRVRRRGRDRDTPGVRNGGS
jgi:YCII-related domain